MCGSVTWFAPWKKKRDRYFNFVIFLKSLVWNCVSWNSIIWRGVSYMTWQKKFCIMKCWNVWWLPIFSFFEMSDHTSPFIVQKGVESWRVSRRGAWTQWSVFTVLGVKGRLSGVAGDMRTKWDHRWHCAYLWGHEKQGDRQVQLHSLKGPEA